MKRFLLLVLFLLPIHVLGDYYEVDEDLMNDSKNIYLELEEENIQKISDYVLSLLN